MKRLICAASAAIVATAAVVASVPAAEAAPPKYSYNVYAGATQVQALGVAVQSDATAEAKIVGNTSQRKRNKIASARAGTLLSAGVARTEVIADRNPETNGLRLVATSRTAGVSLLGGLIRASAIVTKARIVADGSGTPTTRMTTRLLGLTIQGEPYEADIKPNTGITIPGVVSIMLNQQQTGAAKDSAAIFGAGLRVTLLGARNGTTAGATVAVNPVSQILSLGNGGDPGGYALGGTAYGSYVTADVGDEVEVESGQTAMVHMRTGGTAGQEESNSTARVNLGGVLNVGAIHSEQRGIRSDALSQVTESTTIASLSLFNGLVSAKALGTRSQVRITPRGAAMDGDMTFATLRIAGEEIPVDVAPNTTLHIANLGKVTINQHRKVVRNGMVHAYRTIGVLIVLDTARAGLPVGARVEIATTQAQVWH